MYFEARTLTELRNNNNSLFPVRILVDGVYDLFHCGHVESLRQAKEAFPNVTLVVIVCRDEDVMFHKGGRTVMSYEERVRSVQECKYVDEVVSGYPYYYTLQELDTLKCDLVAHDDLPYNTNGVLERDSGDFFAPFKRADRFLATKRTEGISTTNLIQRILDASTEFTERNARRNAA